MRCVWAPQVPSRNPTPQSLLLGVQGPQVHSAHSLPGPPFFILSATPGNRAQDSPFLWSGLTWPPAPFQSPAPAASPFFLATAEVSASKARRARRRKLRRCILRGEHGSESPPGAAGVDPPPQLCPSSQARPKGSGCYCGGLGGAGPSPPARAHSGRNLPGGLLEPGTQLRPPPRLRTPDGQRLGGPKPPRALRSPARSLARCPRARLRSQIGRAHV